ncbi:MAG: T9SS type A sorting domain-containing protein [Chitinophagaceae bacterium]|nr:T9SS type A sorting domain-containing protein [Chitinophagaceae bacterium]
MKFTFIPVYGIKMIALFIFAMIVMKAQSQYYAPELGLPYLNTLNGMSPTGITIGGSAVFTPNDGVRLTPNTTSQAGNFFMNDAKFDTKNGIHIEFEYASNPNSTGADGITMILYNGNGNGTETAFNVGATGAGLGYTYNRRDNDVTPVNNALVVPGVKYGYLGLGLDEFGNYKNIRNESIEHREGVSDNAPGWANGSSHVTLRGPGNPDTTFGNPNGISATAVGNNKIFPWCSGYPVLHTVQTTNAGTANRNYSASLNPATGGYIYSTTPTVSVARSFTLGTSTTNPVWDPANTNYRKVFVDIVPIPLLGTAPQNTLLIYVTIQHGSLKDTIIKGYELPNNNIKAIDNATTLSTANATRTINAKIPEFLNIAFAASTGARMNFHYIRNLYIVTPYSAGVTPQTQFTCSNDSSSYIFPNIFNNDSAYTGEFTGNLAPTASQANIDSSSFVFSTESLSVPANFNTIYGADSVKATTAQGVWVFNYKTKVVTFTPAPSNTLRLGTIYYSIKGKGAPFNNEAYRSVGATLSVISGNAAQSIQTSQIDVNDYVNDPAPNHDHRHADLSFETLQLVPEGGAATGLTYSSPDLETTTGNKLHIDAKGEITGNVPTQGHYEFTVVMSEAGKTCPAVAKYTINTTAPLTVTYSAPLKAAIVNNSVRLDWQTATETNNKHFMVQHSADGATWQSIGTVNSFFPTGTGNGHAYSFMNKNPLPGNNFYRLQQVDISGSVELSSIVNVSYEKNTVMYISPNPAKGAIKVHHLPENASVRIIDTNGEAYSFPVKDGNINIGSLSAGVYFVQLSVSNSVIARLKFVKR